MGLAGYDENTAANDADNVISIELQMAMGQSNFSGATKQVYRYIYIYTHTHYIDIYVHTHTHLYIYAMHTNYVYTHL